LPGRLCADLCRCPSAPGHRALVRRLGRRRLDELSLAGGNEWPTCTAGHRDAPRCPCDAGLATAPVDAIRGGDATYNAAALQALLDGQPGPYRDAVLFNAAAALMVAGEVTDWHEGVEEAAETIDKGLALGLLRCWIDALKSGDNP
jgi:anthranilate phosphoribosyltransferase